MKNLFIFIFLFFSCNCLIAQTRLQKDTSKIIVRHFNYNNLQKYRKDKDFQYMQLSEPPKSIWERFWSWVWQQAIDIMRTRNGKTIVWTILFLAAAAAIVFFITKVMGMNKEGLFGRSGGRGLQYSLAEEDIHAISFDKAIRDAADNNNFRLAIRLLYLQSLKQLSDKGYIEWQKDKTNNEYITEVTGKPWQALFKKLTGNFEYTWYGERNVSNESYQHIYNQFQQFNNQLS